ncbi:MAG: hypothetical protein AB7F72_07780 [Afipia sp.]
MSDMDDTVGGRRAYHKFLFGLALGLIVIGGALGYSSRRMDVGKVFPIVGVPSFPVVVHSEAPKLPDAR